MKRKEKGLNYLVNIILNSKYFYACYTREMQRREKKFKKEVILANEAAIHRKLDQKKMEKKEMEDILIYQAMRDAELAKREEDERDGDKNSKQIKNPMDSAKKFCRIHRNLYLLYVLRLINE